jgi:hypothetical protein
MKKIIFIIFILVLLCSLLFGSSGCTSPTDLKEAQSSTSRSISSTTADITTLKSVTILSPTPSLNVNSSSTLIEKADLVLVERKDENISVNLPKTWNNIDMSSKEGELLKQAGYLLFAFDPIPHPTTSRTPGSFSVNKQALSIPATLDDLEAYEVNSLESSPDILKPIVNQRVQLQVGEVIQFRYQRKISRTGGQVETVEYLQYEFLSSTSLYILTFETYPDQTGKYIPIYEEIANSFKFLQ